MTDSPIYMAGIICAEIDTGATSVGGQYYLDAAAELSKLERKNWTQTKRDGTPLVYDLLVTLTTDESTTIEYSCSTAPNNWQTRNAVKMAKKLRDRLWKDSGVKPGMIGTYAKELRCNLDSGMHAVTYSPAVSGGDSIERIYAHSAMRPASAGVFTGGTWDYSELGTHLDAGFNLNVCGDHNAAEPGPYTYVGCIVAYNQARQTVQAESPLTGDLVDTDSPFMQVVPQTDTADEILDHVEIYGDAPPYDRSVSGDSDALHIAAFGVLNNQSGLNQSFRIQAPLGLVKLHIGNSNANSDLAVKFECLGTYEM